MNAKKKILVIDDELTILKLCDIVLSDAGLDVRTLNSTVNAQEIVKEEVFDLILTDIKVPELSGIEFYTNLLQSNPEMAKRVLFMTGSVMGMESRKFLESSGRPYLLKPFRPEDLKEFVSGAFTQLGD